MEIKKGIAASPGIAIAEAMILDSEDYRIPRRSIEDSQRMDEVSRVRAAFKEAIHELSELEAPKQTAKAGKINFLTNCAREAEYSRNSVTETISLLLTSCRQSRI